MRIMAAPVFWLVIAALSMLNFGADLIVAGSAHLSGGDVMVMTGSWLMVGGVAILVWAATRRRLPRREVGHDVDRHLVAADDRAAVRRIRHAHHLFLGRVGQLDAFRHVPAPGNPVDGLFFFKQKTAYEINWRRVGEIEGGSYPHTQRLYLSMGCNHCLEPSCLAGCPVDAYTKNSVTGLVLHNAQTCIGCGYCTWNCPYGVP